MGLSLPCMIGMKIGQHAIKIDSFLFLFQQVRVFL